MINTSTLYVGGAVQVALSFIHELKKYHNEYHILLSPAISKQIRQETFGDNFAFYLIEYSTASLKTRLKIVSKLNEIEKKIAPQIVFSVFGPSYWRPKSKHLLGFADGWVYNPKTIAYNKLSFFKKYKMKLHVEYKKYYLLRDVDYFILETRDASKKFIKVLDVDEKRVFTVGNTYSSVYNNKELLNENNQFYIKLPAKNENIFRFLYIAHNHPSKNIGIINEILKEYDGNNIEFILTLDSNSLKKIFPILPKQVINLGPVPLNSCPSLYAQCDAIFAPTLLETFTAVYPEAMKMKKPILTSNLSFATDICNNAALYFNPLDVNDIIKTIKLIINDKKLQNTLVEEGLKQLEFFETSESRTKKYLEICKFIIEENNK